MKYILKYIRINKSIKLGFVLPFTLFISGIMLLISLGISTILQKQIFFSQVARDSQAAYYAADNAVACVISIEETYVNATGTGIFPYDSSSLTQLEDMDNLLIYVNGNRTANGYSPLAPNVSGIKCAQSNIFTTDQETDFKLHSDHHLKHVHHVGELDLEL